MVWGAEWWDAFTAFGTVGAVLVAVFISLFEAWRHRRTRKAEREEAVYRTASLVSAWIETDYTPSQNGTRYEKNSTLMLSNESDEPVYNIMVNVALPNPFRQVGPLAVPVPIPTLAPRTVRRWDISPGLLAHEHSEGNINLSEPLARISFTDPRQQRWVRDYTGELKEDIGSSDEADTEYSPENELQMGQLSRLNPLVVALSFLNALQETDSPSADSFPGTLDQEAAKWKAMTTKDWVQLADMTAGYALPTHVYYRTPRVAYVRLLKETEQDSESAQPRQNLVPVEVITLVFRGALGWRVFSFGPTSPEWIAFKPGETLAPFRAYLDSSSEGNDP